MQVNIDYILRRANNNQADYYYIAWPKAYNVTWQAPDSVMVPADIITEIERHIIRDYDAADFPDYAQAVVKNVFVTDGTEQDNVADMTIWEVWDWYAEDTESYRIHNVYFGTEDDAKKECRNRIVKLAKALESGRLELPVIFTTGNDLEKHLAEAKEQAV